MTRPAETIQATVSALIGALLILYGVVKNGFDFEDLQNPEVQGAIVLIVGFVSAAVTWYVSRRQRDGELPSSRDGTVQ
jgi:uncharacterized membrane protein HdeD (DUF308 family)